MSPIVYKFENFVSRCTMYWIINILRHSIQLPGSERTIFAIRYERCEGKIRSLSFASLSTIDRGWRFSASCSLRGNYFRYFQLSQQCHDLIEIVGTLARARYFHLSSLDYDFSHHRHPFCIHTYNNASLRYRDNEYVYLIFHSFASQSRNWIIIYSIFSGSHQHSFSLNNFACVLKRDLEYYYNFLRLIVI